jgi:hypothetical protein
MSQSNRKLLLYLIEARSGEAAAARLRGTPLCDTSLIQNDQPLGQAL